MGLCRPERQQAGGRNPQFALPKKAAPALALRVACQNPRDYEGIFNQGEAWGPYATGYWDLANIASGSRSVASAMIVE